MSFTTQKTTPNNSDDSETESSEERSADTESTEDEVNERQQDINKSESEDENELHIACFAADAGTFNKLVQQMEKEQLKGTLFAACDNTFKTTLEIDQQQLLNGVHLAWLKYHKSII